MALKSYHSPGGQPNEYFLLMGPNGRLAGLNRCCCNLDRPCCVGADGSWSGCCQEEAIDMIRTQARVTINATWTPGTPSRPCLPASICNGLNKTYVVPFLGIGEDIPDYDIMGAPLNVLDTWGCRVPTYDGGSDVDCQWWGQITERCGVEYCRVHYFPALTGLGISANLFGSYINGDFDSVCCMSASFGGIVTPHPIKPTCSQSINGIVAAAHGHAVLEGEGGEAAALYCECHVWDPFGLRTPNPNSTATISIEPVPPV